MKSTNFNKKFTRGINNKFDLAEERTNLNIGQLKASSWPTKEKRIEKNEHSHRCEVLHQIYQYTENLSQERREEAERILEDNGLNSLNLVIKINLHIEAVQ